MHLDALKYFVTVVEEKSISKAATNLHLSQSALSQMIHKLEEDFGHELLNRSNRGVTITPMGEIVLKHSHNILKNFDKMIEEIKLSSENQNKVTIAGTWSLAAYSLPCMLYRIKKEFPKLRFVLEARTVKEILGDIKNDIAEFGFVDYIDESEKDLVFHRIGLEKVVLIAKYNYKIKNKISLMDLLNVELIMCTMNDKTCDHLKVALEPLGKNLENLNVIFNSDTLTSVKSSVMNGYGMAFVPYEAIKHELYEKSVKLIDVDDINLDYDIYLVSKKPKLLSPIAKMTRDYLIEDGSKSFC